MGEKDFINEVVKEKKSDYRQIGKHIMLLVGAAVIFGSVAGVTFGSVRDHMEKEAEIPKLQLEEAEKNSQQPEAGAIGTSPQEEKEKEGEKGKITEDTETLGLEEYQEVYQAMAQLASKASGSLATVMSIQDTMDIFQNPYQDTKRTTGVLLAKTDKDLYYLTEYRGVQEADQIQILYNTTNMAVASLVKYDKRTGFCVLRVSIGDLDPGILSQMDPMVIDNDNLVHQGDPIIALGSPMGYSGALAFGIVTSVSNKVREADMELAVLTTDIQGTEEGSGILLNLEGEMIGVLSQKYANAGKMVTAVAISDISGLLSDLMTGKDIPYLGVHGENVTLDISKQTGIPIGVYVESVEEGSPGLQAGVKNGDVIVGLNGLEIRTLAQFMDGVAGLKRGQEVTLEARRIGTNGYEKITFDVTVGAL